MSIIYQLLELFATFVEGAIAVAVPIELAGRKLEKKKNILYILVMTVIYTDLITLMNNWQTFSFVTIGIAILFSLVSIYFVTTKNILYKVCAVLLAWFFINATDYLISYSLIMLLGHSLNVAKCIPLILNPGPPRTVFILANKSIQIVLFSSFYKLYPKLKQLKQKSVWLLLVITSTSYIVISILTNLVITDSILTLQIAIIFSVFFIVISIIATIISIAISSKHQNKKREMDLMAISNSMMVKNYTELKYSQDTIRKQVHDFKNHLQTIYGMMSEESNAKEYVEGLIETSFNQAQLCHSGNDVIDSIINCKMNIAQSNGIDFKFKITLNSDLTISPIDICAILANQLDNSIEACLKIDDITNRFINVDIWQKEALVFFKVVNSTNSNPFNSSNKLFTTKKDKTLHGLGIKNILETTEKYNGSLKNECENNTFTSLAMISNNI